MPVAPRASDPLNVQRLGYVSALDGLRGVAIALVLAEHYAGVLGGALGVDLFFALSGFLISTLLLEEFDHQGCLSLRRFYGRRARRLLPALISMLAFYLVAAAALGRNELATTAAGAFYTANFVAAFTHGSGLAQSGLAQLWSLAEEEQFYLLWPVILVAVARRRRPVILVSALILLLISYRIGLAATGASHERLYFGPDTHMDGLLGGALLALLRRRGFSVSEAAAKPALVALIVAVFARGILIDAYGSAWDAYGLPLFELVAVVLVGAAVSNTTLAEVLAIRPLVWLGKVSYSLYLWHYAILWLIARDLIGATPTTRASLEYTLPALVLSVAAAWCSWRFVEQPFRRLHARSVRVSPAPVSS